MSPESEQTLLHPATKEIEQKNVSMGEIIMSLHKYKAHRCHKRKYLRFYFCHAEPVLPLYSIRIAMQLWKAALKKYNGTDHAMMRQHIQNATEAFGVE